MIEVIDEESVHASGLILEDIYRFRHRVFVEHAGWSLPVQGDFEMDQFDTPAAVHLVRRSEMGLLIGVTRLLPTISPYMIQTLWPFLLDGDTPTVSPGTWEVTRFGVEPVMSPEQRASTAAELVLACLEVGLSRGIERMVAVMTEPAANRIVRGMGWQYQRCGAFRLIGDCRVAAVRMELDFDALAGVRQRTGIPRPVTRCCPMAVRRPETMDA